MINFEVLKQISKNLEHTSYEDILRLLEELEISYIMTFNIPKGTLISRIRPSERKPYCKESQISYNPNPENYGRANKPNEPIFYGSIQGPGMLNSLDTNVWEWLNILNSKPLNKIDFPLSFTSGFWEIQSDLPTIPIIYNNVSKEKTKLFDSLLENYEKHSGVTELSSKIIEFLANEYSKVDINSPNDYKLTAAFSELIRTRIGKKYHQFFIRA
ncbi:hypothetical protein [Zobellia laminariae]|uniref:hypothetical protein n=1 Tax=Zobellia laminariae TaxID=248906 RepID=UPI0026F448F4|nr:hypothetical protein [Zobellia laminariae]WKX76687.1 hypothetical protein Q5W13_00460 [Zobellia laminariae]